MKRRSKARGNVNKLGRRKAAKLQRVSTADAAPKRHATADSPSAEIARLRLELNEARDRENATTEVLRVIGSSSGDLKPAFDAVLTNAVQICDAKFGNLLLFEDGALQHVAFYGAPEAYLEERRRDPMVRVAPGSDLDQVVKTKQVAHTLDIQASGAASPAIVKLAGARTVLTVPMLKESELVGVLGIYRQEVRPFTDSQIALLRTFAAQAVIAIENARLLNELRERTTDLAESLEQQTATSQVLQVISASPGDLAPVFQAMLANAVRICQANFGMLWLSHDDGFRSVAVHGLPAALSAARSSEYIVHFDRDTPFGRLVATKRLVQVEDIRAEPAYKSGFQPLIELGELGGARTLLVVPMLKEGALVGTFAIYRQEVRPFTDKQIDLLQSFAAQAVIAIENARLLNELRQSLEQQTATAEVLRVISSSPGDLEPVFNTMLSNAVRICQARFGNLALFDGRELRLVATHNAPREYEELRRGNPVIPLERSLAGTIVRTKQTTHITDLSAEEPYASSTSPLIFVAGARAALGVPMLREDELIGEITVYRQEARPFADKQVELLTNFAAQAVIAIENARLLSELRVRTADLTESLEQQTATADVLRVISSSPGELELVFQAMLKNATRICEAKFGILQVCEGDAMRTGAVHNAPPALLQAIAARGPLFRPGRRSAIGRTIATKQMVHITDYAADDAYKRGEPAAVGLIENAGARTVLIIPMLKEEDLIGTIAIYRQEVRFFTDKQIELVKNFASQAVIAIENARLLNELRQRTEDLSKSLEDLRTTQDRLVQTQKLASLGQLTAGIAHEIKNPLNFVNNFSGVSVELLDELQEVLRVDVSVNNQRRTEIDELANTLRNNLDKIVQHGKRADAIVKNMLLHSREGSGERRPVDINALADEALSLAYHGARGEKQGFNITLERSFDPAAGEADVYPQEISRVLINLISNGFYATAKRHAQAEGKGYEPTLMAATKDLGDRVEIRIRDNGIGVPPEVREKMFNPFFTTKPAGEGTGLGLSISYDIIVKQHSGSIEVDTEAGEFTEFRIVLPRAAA